jgi:FKBP-type peptidyl-prolyl cis-trans isomerase SlyD
LTYIQGAGQIVHGLEKELAGLKVGDQKKVQVKPEEGYGQPDPKAFQEIPKEKVPLDAHKVGAMLMTKSPQGQAVALRVSEIKEKTIVVDFNHPLAGKTLNFDKDRRHQSRRNAIARTGRALFRVTSSAPTSLLPSCPEVFLGWLSSSRYVSSTWW